MSLEQIQPVYTAVATAENGRDGRVASDDGHLDVVVNPPKEMGGSGDGTNPEQLFAAGFGACFQSAMGAVARQQKLDIKGSTVTAKVSLGKLSSGGFGLAVELVATVPTLDEATTKDLLEKADQVCPYSNATRGNIELTLTAA